MWMMGCNDGGEFHMAAESFNGRKLRPLVPRPATTAAPSSSNMTRFNGTDLLALNHHLATVAHDQSKRDNFNTQQQVVVSSSRWNPTPEQLQTLEELYCRGTRTPSADEIQQITAQLRRYGKIEGKNVFYWFQNHKARERQKRRRQLESNHPHFPTRDHIDQYHPERKDSGVNIRTGCEVEETMNWGILTNCSTFSEKTVSMQRTAKTAAEQGWIHYEEGEIQCRRNGTWQVMPLSSCSPPTNLINSTTATTTACTATNSSTTPTTPITTTKLKKSQDLIISPYRQDVAHFVSVGNVHHQEESQTLQLFPLNSTGSQNHGEEPLKTFPATNLRPRQFIEFLPLKN